MTHAPAKGRTFRRISAAVNKAVLPLVSRGPGRRLFGGAFAVLTYTGRKSGRVVTLPVNYRRAKDGSLTVGVMAPEAKVWWRNFTGDGGPVDVQLGNTTRPGHAVATRTDSGGVSVRITLN